MKNYLKFVYYQTIIVVALFLISCDKSEIYDKKKNEYEGATIEFQEVTTLYSEDAKLKIKIEAAQQQVFANNDVYYPKGIRISMYNTQGFKTTDLKADTGRYEYSTQQYKGIGNVIVTNLEQQQTLYTDELLWWQGRKEITTEKAIRIITPKEQLNGIGLVSNEEFSQYTIKKPTGIFSLENQSKQTQNPK
jgi:LPS export ABC transporter protein LptC